jgi:carbon-monoxide dehydrogenase small subunit
MEAAKRMKRLLTLNVNGQSYDLAISPNRTLLEVLREDIGLTGTKRGCNEGDCGACTVLLNDEPVPSCMILAVDAHDQEIITIEGLAVDGLLHPVQQAFIDHGALQCGFCTPGMILTAVYLLDQNPNLSDEEIRSGLAGNLCRCTGYVQILEAVAACRDDRFAATEG